MSKKRGLGAKRGLDTLLNSSKVGRQVVGVIDDAKAIMPKPSDGSVMAHDQLLADDSAITDTPSNDQISTKMAPQTQAPANDSADQRSAAHHIEPSMLDHQADASEDAPNQTASIVSEADDSELTDALSKLAEYQQREILLFWQYGLSMRDDG